MDLFKKKFSNSDIKNKYTIPPKAKPVMTAIICEYLYTPIDVQHTSRSKGNDAINNTLILNVGMLWITNSRLVPNAPR